MKKHYVFLPLVLIFGLLLASCKSKSNDIINNPITPKAVGNIYISSVPASAQIWLDGTNTGKITPDSINNINASTHIVILKLTDYLNDTVSVNVQDGSHITLNRTLLRDKSVANYGPITIWAATSDSIVFPRGIILKTGRSSLLTSGGKDSVDIYYSSNGFVITTPSSSINNRYTSFFVGLSTNLNDSVESPTVLNSWVTQVQNTETNYFFLFDSDSCYSKMIIIADSGGGTSGSPAWIKVQWLHNNKPNDRRF
jgi:hypothetical protein